jgi:hypothetical protein
MSVTLVELRRTGTSVRSREGTGYGSSYVPTRTIHTGSEGGRFWLCNLVSRLNPASDLSISWENKRAPSKHHIFIFVPTSAIRL